MTSDADDGRSRSVTDPPSTVLEAIRSAPGPVRAPEDCGWLGSSAGAEESGGRGGGGVNVVPLVGVAWGTVVRGTVIGEPGSWVASWTAAVTPHQARAELRAVPNVQAPILDNMRTALSCPIGEGLIRPVRGRCPCAGPSSGSRSP